MRPIRRHSRRRSPARGRCALLYAAAAWLVAAPLHATPARIVMTARAGVSAADLDRLRRETEAAAGRVDSWLHVDAANLTIRCDVYATLEAKGLATSFTLPTHAVPDDSLVVCSAEPGFDGEAGREVAALIIALRAGHSPCEALGEGVAVACASNWREMGCHFWARRLAGYGDVADLAYWLDNDAFGLESPLVRRAVAGELAVFLMKLRGPDAVMRAFHDGLPPGSARDDLARLWRAHVRELAGEKADAGRAMPAGGFLRGFCHAHEGYAILDGYLSAASDRALARLRALGANAVSVTPFTFVRAPHQAGRFPFCTGARAENDESVIHATLAARHEGMSVMLKPHVWVGRGWPGDISFASAREWEEFFTCYERWIRHYALLAEMEHIDLLCVGVEMAGTTVGHEAQWIAMVERLRRVYRGQLTYAANWGGEFEHVSFWKAFDYIGINCYYPLAAGDEADDGALAAGAKSVMDRIDVVSRRYDRRVLITEVGFPRTSAPWRAPHDDSGEQDAGLEAQARCFDAFLAALRGRERIAGVYCWKWPSDLSLHDRHDGFMLNGTPAETVISSWYTRALAR